jgi:hypothetical protein
MVPGVLDFVVSFVDGKTYLVEAVDIKIWHLALKRALNALSSWPSINY